jgi:hypothetical protein
MGLTLFALAVSVGVQAYYQPTAGSVSLAVAGILAAVCYALACWRVTRRPPPTR